MSVKIGETATASVTVDVQFRCSNCGKDNLALQTVSGKAETSTVFGVNLKGDLAGSAREDLVENLEIIMNPNDPLRYRLAQFDCKCQRCGHAEPWARMHCKRLDLFTKLGIGLLFLLFIPFIATLSLRPVSAFHIIVWAVMGLTIAFCIGSRLYKTQHIETMDMLSRGLDREFQPTVSLYSRERHLEYHDQQRAATGATDTAPQIDYGTWTCKCGAQNSLQYAQCKKCGSMKGM